MKVRVGIVIGLAVVVLVLVMGSWEPGVVVTPLPPARDDAPAVGPLVLAPGSLLVIDAPEFHAEIDASGRGRILSTNRASAEGSEARSEALTLDPATLEMILGDLGRLKALWSARKVGEAAAIEPGDVSDTAEQTPAITVEERMADGTARVVLRLGASSPEFEETHRALTPLRFR